MIILLNGASSAGKSTILKELQVVFDDLFLGMSVDKFMSMVPPNHQGFGSKAAQMWSWEQSFDQQGELMTLKVGPLGKSYILGMYECIRVMAERGFNVIVDDVCLDAELLRQIATQLAQFKVYFIGITCELPILEERERLRGNRVIHSARSQHGVVHSFCEHDLIIDTSKTSARDCALKIKTFVEENPTPQAFRLLEIENGSADQE